MQVRLGMNFSTSASANKIAFVDIFLLRGPVGLRNDEIGLQYFKINITIEELKFAYFYSEIYGIPYL